MRRALIGIFMATAIASPLAAQSVEDVPDERESMRPPSEVVRIERPSPQERRVEIERRVEEEQPSREERREERSEPQTQRSEPSAENHHSGDTGRAHERPASHKGLHREYRREHRDLHRSNPTRREHRRFHREVKRDHRDAHRDTHQDLHRDYRREHQDLHRSNPTRREHRRFHRNVNRDHNRYHGQWDHNWRRDRRYDWQGYRYYNRSLFDLGRYYSPYRGHSYRRFSIGVRLGSSFYSHPYWISDPWRYRLPPAYSGTRWVRYYDDVLLVDLFTGEVVDVIYNFFW